MKIKASRLLLFPVFLLFLFPMTVYYYFYWMFRECQANNFLTKGIAQAFRKSEFKDFIDNCKGWLEGKNPEDIIHLTNEEKDTE